MIKRLYALIGLILLGANSLGAQKTYLVDMEYVLSKIPAYTAMQKQLEAETQKMQAAVTKLETETATLYKNYQAEAARLSATAKVQREEAIVAKEKEAYELKRKYFGPEGQLVKRREELMKPIQEKVWAQIKSLALRNSITLVIDKASGKIIYADPAADISPLLLKELGYSEE